MYKDGTRQKGGHAYRQHQTLKGAVRKRDNYTCQLCGNEGWQVDHIIPWLLSHDSTLTNLRVLCRSCNTATRRTRPSVSSIDYEVYLRTELSKY